MRYVIAYLSTAFVFFGLDFIWLGAMGDRLYRKTLGDVLLPAFDAPPALVFYALYVIGILFFAVWPAFEDNRLSTAVVRGALFGFFAYATYDLSNQATVRNWTLTLSLTDMAWGTFLTGAAAAAGFLITRALKGA